MESADHDSSGGVDHERRLQRYGLGSLGMHRSRPVDFAVPSHRIRLSSPEVPTAPAGPRRPARRRRPMQEPSLNDRHIAQSCWSRAVDSRAQRRSPQRGDHDGTHTRQVAGQRAAPARRDRRIHHDEGVARNPGVAGSVLAPREQSDPARWPVRPDPRRRAGRGTDHGTFRSRRDRGGTSRRSRARAASFLIASSGTVVVDEIHRSDRPDRRRIISPRGSPHGASPATPARMARRP
jgi:hypothetical protein